MSPNDILTKLVDAASGQGTRLMNVNCLLMIQERFPDHFADRLRKDTSNALQKGKKQQRKAQVLNGCIMLTWKEHRNIIHCLMKKGGDNGHGYFDYKRLQCLVSIMITSTQSRQLLELTSISLCSLKVVYQHFQTDDKRTLHVVHIH